MLTFSSGLVALLAAATTKAEWATILNTALGTSKRIRCYRNGTEFRNVAIANTVTADSTGVHMTGPASNQTVSLAGDLSSGACVLRVEGGGHYVEGSFGLAGSNADFIADASYTTTNGFANKGITIAPPPSLPTSVSDGTPPTVSLASSSTSVTAAGSITLTATAADNVGVDHVEFYRGASLIGTDTGSPFTASVALTGSDNGTINFTAKAYDAAGNNVTSNTVAVTVNISVTVGSLLATMTVANTSGSTVATEFIPPMFGHPFKKGDIPAGAYPKFELVDGTNVPYTMFNKVTWSDGSLRFASFLARVPTTISGSGAVSLRVKSTNSAPATSSSRTTADLSSGSTNLNVEVIGADNLSGTWVSSLNTALVDPADAVLFGDGAVGKVWRIRQPFRQGGSPHGQLECFWYVAALQNAAGGLYGLRYLGRVSQPWYDLDNPNGNGKTHRAFSSFLLKNGASTVRNCWSGHTTPIAVTWPNTPNRAYDLTATGHGLPMAALVKFSGTPPSPLVAGTSYWMNRVDANTIFVHSTSSGAVDGSAINLTNGGSSPTILGYPYVAQFGSLWTCGAAAQWDYIQAGGTVAADATVRVQHDKAYWQTTGVIPTYETVTPPTQSTYSYEPHGYGPFLPFAATSGEQSALGVMPSWSAVHLQSQSANDERTVRVAGMCGGHASIQLYNSTTKTIPNGKTGGPYSGMPTGNQDFRWSSAIVSGFTAPSGGAAFGVYTLANDHMPAMEYYAYVLTGEPQFLDLVIEKGNQALIHRYSGTGTSTATSGGAERNVTVNGTSYSGVTVFNSDQFREDAWSTRDVAVAAGLVPDAAPQCTSYKAYFNDINNNTFNALNNHIANVAPAFWRTSGLVHFHNNGGHGYLGNSWMIGYWVMANAMAAKLTENTAALAVLNHMVKWPTYIHTNLGIWYVPYAQARVRVASDSGSAFITSASEMRFQGGLAVSWSSGSPTFNWSNSTVNGYVPANGDRILFDDGYMGGPPGNFTAFATYHVVNKSGGTFQLSASSGGSAITPNNSGGTGTMFLADTPPTGFSGTIDQYVYEANYVSNVLGGLKLAKAAGATVNQSTIDALETKVASVNFAVDPRYRFADHY